MSPKNILRLIVIIGVVGAIYYLESQKPPQPNKETSLQAEQKIKDTQQATEQGATGAEAEKNKLRRATKAKQYELAKEISTPDGFVNTKNITISELIGKKVILVDFWTYSCINCRRTIPYLNSWYEKYKDQGLEIIGIHTPEFEFEHDYVNVSRETKLLGIKYPVVLDNDYSTWTSYQNRYWPRKYLIDIDGFIVYDHAGEGNYDVTEKKIQEALQERMAVLGLTDSLNRNTVKPVDAETVDFNNLRSPETYFGSGRNDLLGNGLAHKTGAQILSSPLQVSPSTLYLAGNWEFNNEFAMNASSDARITYRYQGQKVFFVASALTPVTIKILRDGKPLGKNSAGQDVTVENGESYATIKDDRLYRLIENTEPGEHTLEIIIQKPGLKAFTFTFG